MADINDINAAQSVKIVGSDSSGVEQTPVRSTAAGGLHSNLVDSTGVELASFDMDNTGGVSKILGVTLRGLANGTPVELGNTANPFRVDPVGTTVQPVSGSINVNKVAIVGLAPATANVTTASTIVVPANASRKGLTIINLTNTKVFLSFESNAATVNSGIMLANGGSFSMDNFSFTLGAVRAIVASGNSILSIQEFA